MCVCVCVCVCVCTYDWDTDFPSKNLNQRLCLVILWADTDFNLSQCINDDEAFKCGRAVSRFWGWKERCNRIFTCLPYTTSWRLFHLNKFQVEENSCSDNVQDLPRPCHFQLLRYYYPDIKLRNEHCCIKHCWRVYEQNSIVNSVDDWTAEWAMIASN